MKSSVQITRKTVPNLWDAVAFLLIMGIVPLFAWGSRQMAVHYTPGESGLDGSMLSVLDDTALKGVMFSEEIPPRPSKRPLPDFSLLQKELKRKGVTLQLLWEE